MPSADPYSARKAVIFEYDLPNGYDRLNGSAGATPRRLAFSIVDDRFFASRRLTGMEDVRTRADYGRVVCATFVWAGVTALIAMVIGLPLFVLGPYVLVQCLCRWIPTSVGTIASGLISTAIGGLILYGALRCIVLSVVRVCRSPGYPDRHWWFARRTFRNVVRTELILLAATLATAVVAIRSDGPLGDRAELATGIAGAVFVYYQLVMVARLNDVLRHASVVPYFRRRVGEINTYSSGESLARHVEELDEVARTNAVVPLSAFGWGDDLEGEPVVWHASAEGLKTVNFLLVTLERDETGWDDHAATIADLKQIAQALERADSLGIPFSLLLLHSTVTNGQEWDARQGTCA
jgi:hypothetical protein